MDGIGREGRRILDEAWTRFGEDSTGASPGRTASFEETMEVLGAYLVAEGIGDDGELNELGHRIEEFEDWLVSERINSEADLHGRSDG